MSAAAAPLTSSTGARLLRRPTQSRHRARLARSSTTVQSSAASTDVEILTPTIADRVKLGTSEITVGATGVGAWAWGDRSGYWGKENAETAKDNLAAFRTLLKGGVDFVDTAEVYGFGKSEELLNEFMSATAGDASMIAPVLATKFAPLPLRWTADAVPDALKSSLARMGKSKIGLYMQHWPAFGIQDRANDAFLEGLCRCYEQGLCDAVGVSNFNAARVTAAAKLFAARGVPFASNQVQYSLIYRGPETDTGVLEACNNAGVTLVAYSPMAQGLLTGKYASVGGVKPAGPRGAIFTDARRAAVDGLVGTLREVGAAHGDKTPAQVAVNYCMSKGTVPIPGAKDAKQAASVVGCLGWRLEEAEVQALERAARAVPASPGAPFETW
mmetsp:Transcript_19341/g.48315  ORF Transcript_19341/g.48315 Transcript_19341/m.48315 type:complete len:385 (-) Transcript_19341:671-1825(-)